MSLNSCEHDEGIMVFDSIKCPYCELQTEKEDLENNLSGLQAEIDRVESN